MNVSKDSQSLHYSPYRRVVLHHEELFKKVIESKGRGGYCMELNAVFGTLLRSIGFAIYPTGARVHDGKEFGGWQVSQVVFFPSILTTIKGTTW
jgi:hypothetical protein